MYLELQQRLGNHLRALLKQKYDLDVENIPIEIPPELKFGELSSPIAFELARKLRKAPKIIAQEIVAELESSIAGSEGFAGFEVAGAGYINARFDRAAVVQMTLAAVSYPFAGEAGERVGPEAFIEERSPSAQDHVLVEHTSINPNKAAHIGHLRNAILGDTFVRLLRAAGKKVDVQNYIDNTGVQVADVVVGFLHLEGKSIEQVRALIAECEKRSAALYQGTASVVPETAQSEKRALAPVAALAPIDYYCWDLYARTSQWYSQGSDQEKEAKKRIRLDTLHAIEHGGNETAEIAELISTAVLRRHLETMLRLGIEYDFLPRESEILHLKFWEAAFEQLKTTGVLYFETEGKNKGCWVMRRAVAPADGVDAARTAGMESGATDEDAKVIVRSNGTVTYVGKDIAYHLWKFGLLGKDFGYKPFFSYPRHECWISAVHGEEKHPHFGGARAIYNVIDSRQSDPQSNVIQALRGMGYTEQADRYTHFSYEMVALTPRCAVELGYNVPEEDRTRAYIEVSGRKGFGVKADDLIDKLITATRAEVDARQTGGAGENAQIERAKIARQIAIGALRYFMLKYTRNSVIAFDFKDALSFEGETGPYVQYAIVRIRNIFRKGNTTSDAALAELQKIASQGASKSASQQEELDPCQGTTSVVPNLAPATGRALAPVNAGLVSYLAGDDNEDIWSLWLRAARRSLVLEQCIATSEPAYLAKHAFQLAQEFSNFYHRHHILTEEDPARKTLLLATAAVALRELVLALEWLGIESPEAM